VTRGLARALGFLFDLIGVTHHAFSQILIVGEQSEAAKAFGQLVWIERCEGFGGLFHARIFPVIGKQAVKQTRKDLRLASPSP
jgi:hypothetical protein